MLPTFISPNYQPDSITVILDGSASDATKTHFGEYDAVVQLRRARTEESHFNWSDAKIKHVIAKDILIYDEMDVRCLCWFIFQGIKLDLSQASISPRTLDSLQWEFKSLKKRGCKVVEGSCIRVPMLQGFSGMGQASIFALACQEIGFKTIGEPY